jgi:N-dimethylarginine dimethylaminohydrolase
MDLYLMSPPHPNWTIVGRANFRSSRAEIVDPARARREWLRLAEGIEALGGTVAVLPSDPVLSGMPFAANAGHPLPAATPGTKPRFVLPRMKPAHRVGERYRWRPFVEALGFEAVDPATDLWEGQGDVATFQGVTLLFWGARTTRSGLESVRPLFQGEVLELETEELATHGDLAVLPLEHAGSMLACADLLHSDSLAALEARFGRDAIHLVSQEEILHFATNGLPIGDTLLASTTLPSRVRRILERDGMKVVELAMPELAEKAGGSSRCLVCVVPDAPDTLTIPAEARLASWARSLV